MWAFIAAARQLALSGFRRNRWLSLRRKMAVFRSAAHTPLVAIHGPALLGIDSRTQNSINEGGLKC
jgi:hypothetical protein